MGGVLESLVLEGRKICIVSDHNVYPLLYKEISTVFSSFGRVVSFVFPAGEASKRLETVHELYRLLIEEKFDRKDWLVALGGGVVGDLCGYAAATYLRGVRFIQIPTTLLSQVDSSIGGKTGVDFLSYKNMIGAFHMPSLVYTGISSLKTLSAREFSSGMAEVIKHGLIRNASYYDYIEANTEEILNGSTSHFFRILRGSVLIKKSVVEEDPKEKGIRGILNFGHTLGHAMEKFFDFKLTHGECVMLGMLAAMDISEKRGFIREEERERLRRLAGAYSLPVGVKGLDVAKVLEYTLNDKKMEGNCLKFVLLRSIGEAFLDKSVLLQEMESALRRVAHE